MKSEDRYRQAKKTTLISAVVNFFLGLSKLIGGFLFHSHALIADGIHSFSDLLTDAMVLFASKYGSLDADKNHPYGHQRIETAATLFLSMLLIIAGAGISWDAVDALIHSDHTRPGWMSLPVILVSILANEALFHYTRYIGQRIQSDLLITNAWHHRSDAASSVVVLIGLIGSLSGMIYLDSIAAVVVGILIIKMGWEYGWNSVKELVDTAVEPEMLLRIKNIIENINGVDKMHQLRTRLMGGDVFIDVHILVSPQISVSEGHYIAQHVHQSLVNGIQRVKDVTVHVDPEDDEISCPSYHLPNRTIISQLLSTELGSMHEQLVFFSLHYIDGKMIIDLLFDRNFDAWKALKDTLDKLLSEHVFINHFRIMNLQEIINSEKKPMGWL